MVDQSLIEKFNSSPEDIPAITAKILDDQNAAIAALEEGTITEPEMDAAIAAHDADLGAHASQIATAVNTGIADHVALADPHAQYQKESEKGSANGYAPLDNGGKLPIAHLPNSVMQYQGQFNPNLNSPPLADGIGDAGDVYEIQVSGSHDFGSGSINFNQGDWAVYNGTIWEKSINSNEVVSVNGLTGAVSLDTDDIPEGSTNKYFSVAQARAAAVADALADGVTNVAPSQNAVFDALALKADDNAVVHIAGSESITGYKTFNAGLQSNEEILVDSTVNSYASVRSLSVPSSVVASSLSTAGNGNPINKYKAIPFTLGSTQIITRVTLNLRQFTSPTNVTVSLCPDVAGDPDEAAPIVSATTLVSDSNFTDVVFSLAATTLAAGNYWIVFNLPNGIAVQGASGGGVKYTPDSGATWLADSDITALVRYQVFAVGTGNSKAMAVASGDALAGSSGDAILASGDATQTRGAATVFQGLTIQMNSFYVGKSTEDNSVQIVVDNANITNPATPVFLRLGGSGQRLVIRVNSATTVNQLIAQYALQNPAIQEFVITGSGTGTFVNGIVNLNAGNDFGEARIQSDYRSRIQSNSVILGEEGNTFGQFVLQTVKATGANNSNTVFILSGFVEGSGQSGGISIRSADMIGDGSSGSSFFRTGTVHGSNPSGSTTVSTGGTTNFATTNSGGLNLTTGAIGGLSGNSGNIVSNSGNINSGSGTSGSVSYTSGVNNLSGFSGGTGAATYGSGNMSGTNSGATGNVTARAGDKSNASATGNTGSYTARSGNHSGVSGGTGGVSFVSGNITGANIGGNTGTASYNSGSITNASATGSTGTVGAGSGNNAGSGATGFSQFVSGNITNATSVASTGGVTVGTGNHSGLGATGSLNIQSGNITNAGSSAVTGDINIVTGTNAGSGARGTVNITGRYVQLTSQVGGNIHLFTETNGAVAFFANGVLKGAVQTGAQSPYGVAIDLCFAGSSQTATNNIGVVAGNDAGGAAAGGNLLLGAGSATGGNRNGGNVYIYSGAKNGSGTDGNINLIPSGSGKIKLGTSSTTGYVWTAQGTDGSGAWAASGGGGGGFAWNALIKVVGDNGFTAAASDEIYADTSGGAFTLNLPASPTIGQRVRFLDKKGTWTTNNLTIGRNGKNIKGTASNFACNVNYGAVEFIFTDATDGWILVNNNA